MHGLKKTFLKFQIPVVAGSIRLNYQRHQHGQKTTPCRRVCVWEGWGGGGGGV